MPDINCRCSSYWRAHCGYFVRSQCSTDQRSKRWGLSSTFLFTPSIVFLHPDLCPLPPMLQAPPASWGAACGEMSAILAPVLFSSSSLLPVSRTCLDLSRWSRPPSHPFISATDWNWFSSVRLISKMPTILLTQQSYVSVSEKFSY